MVQPQQSPISVEANFTGGLKTEFTGLNFPENACTSTENCVFSLIGDVFRREGIDAELNNTLISIDRTQSAISTYRWNNAGGDGSTQILVLQVGGILYFFQTSNATVASPISTTQLASTVTLSSFSPTGAASPVPTECNFTDGNGYLFVFHPDLDPFYCTFSAGAISATSINVQIRDFTGIPENVLDTYRPLPVSITNTHLYNLQNQGWTSSAPWSATSSSVVTMSVGPVSFNTQAGLPIVLGTTVNISMSITASSEVAGGTGTATGVVNFYSGNTIVINISSFSPSNFNGPLQTFQALHIPFTIQWVITPQQSGGQINTWVTSIGNYPSNADVWWTFKNSSGVFAPSTTISNVTLGSGPAPKGFYIMSAFNQQRSAISGQSGLTAITTTKRPKTGTWFQGRVWYTGVDAAFPSGNNPTSWSESIYFSQIVTVPVEFGRCYQTNDPTSETLFDLLPTDGGVISIQGSGSIYKLFPIQTGLLVFAANGVWHITGSSGIGFSANDYTITKISGVQSISRHSYVDVNGLPVFWNEEGIYEVTPAKSEQRTNEAPTLVVNPLTLGTILSFYNDIPLQSKKYARGAYNPITYVLKWVYKNIDEVDITSRYQFDSVLNFNIANKAFYPYTITGTPFINSINYVAGPGGSTSPDPTFKYLVSKSGQFTFAEERDTTYSDWSTLDTPTNFTSFFVTGYRLTGQAMNKFQPQYIKMFTRNNAASAYSIQAVWDFASDRNSGRYSTPQIINSFSSLYDKLFRRIKLRGHGTALQIKVSSIDGKPFDIMGWTMINDIDSGI